MLRKDLKLSNDVEKFIENYLGTKISEWEIKHGAIIA